MYIIQILNDTADVIVNMDTQMYCLFFVVVVRTDPCANSK